MSNHLLMVSVSTQKDADKLIPVLLQIPAANHGVSYEPALGPVDIGMGFDWSDAGDGPPSVHWVICGSETGPGKREMKQEWAEDVYRQCKAAGVPFFGKVDSNGDPLKVGGKVVREWP